MNDHLYEYLRVCSGSTEKYMWEYLERSRRLGIKWQGVPESREALVAGLEQLARAGLAKGDGGLWWWLSKPRQPVVEPKGGRLLFS